VSVEVVVVVVDGGVSKQKLINQSNEIIQNQSCKHPIKFFVFRVSPTIQKATTISKFLTDFNTLKMSYIRTL